MTHEFWRLDKRSGLLCRYTYVNGQCIRVWCPDTGGRRK